MEKKYGDSMEESKPGESKRKLGMCWLKPDEKADCSDCHTRSCPVNTGNATYEMLFEEE